LIDHSASAKIIQAMGKGLEKIVGHQTVVGDQFEHLFVISLL
jgi:hypothetical protein